MSDRHVTLAPIAAVLGTLGLCCGLPVLVSLGVLGAAAGLSRQSWAMVGLGLALAALGWKRSHRRRKTSPGCDVVGGRARGDDRNSVSRSDPTPPPEKRTDERHV